MSGALPAATTPAEAVSGACMLLRKTAFLESGCMDERYGLHCEDLDLMYRLRQGGRHCLFVPQARVSAPAGPVQQQPAAVGALAETPRHAALLPKFQAPRYPWPLRWAVLAGIWLRYAATLPVAAVRALLRRRTVQ
jgi:hypothetical protein